MGIFASDNGIDKMSRLLIVAFCLVVTAISSFGMTPCFPGNPEEGSSHRWYNETSFEIVNTTGQSFNGIQAIAGYNFNRHLGAGLGVGFERFTRMPLYSSFTANLTMLPVFADFRYTILKSKFSPFIAVNLGYKFLVNIPSTQYISHTDTIFSGMAWNTYYDNDTYKTGGWFLSVDAGLKMKVYKRFSLNCSFGYEIWTVSGVRNSWLYQYLPGSGGGVDEMKTPTTRETSAITHTFLFRIGFGF